jgi:hypothetical protein
VFSSAEGFGTELWEFTSIFVPRNRIPSCFPLPRKGSEQNSEVFCSAEQPEFRRKYPFVPSIPSSVELFFCRKYPTLVETNQINSLTGDTTTEIHRLNEVPSLLLSQSGIPSAACSQLTQESPSSISFIGAYTNANKIALLKPLSLAAFCTNCGGSGICL